MSNTDRVQLLAGLERLEVQLTPQSIDGCLGFLGLIRKWNRKIRIVGDASADDAVDVLLVDSLAPLMAMSTEPGQRWIDVGSGAGLPGILLAIARPEIQVTTVEPIHKKHAFQRTARRELAVKNLEPICARIEDVEEAPFDVAISRATFEIAEWMKRGLELVRPGGTVLGLANPSAVVPPECTSLSYQVGRRERVLVTSTAPE